LAASPASLNRPPQPQAHRQQPQQPSNGPIDTDHQAQGQYRLSFSPTNGEREHHQQQQQPQVAYSGVVGSVARSIFGSSDDETYLVSLIVVPFPSTELGSPRPYLPLGHTTDNVTSYRDRSTSLIYFSHYLKSPTSLNNPFDAEIFGNKPGNPSPIDSRSYSDQQQYLAHERLASIAQQGHAQQPNPHHHQQPQPGDLSPGSPAGYQQQQHTNGFTPHHGGYQFATNTNQARRPSGASLLAHHHPSGVYSLHNHANGLASPVLSNAAWAHTIAAAGPGKRP